MDIEEYKLKKTYINILAGPVQVVVRPGSWVPQLQREWRQDAFLSYISFLLRKQTERLSDVYVSSSL